MALGGGRVIDVAKAISAVDGLRCAAIPTTLSGAEMARGHRMPAGIPEPPPVATPYWSWCRRPSLVIADPVLMASQPMPDLAAGAMNSMAHAAEALWSSYGNPVADDAALRAVGLVSRSLRAPGVDRDGIALGALLAGFSVANSHIAFHHALCQMLARVTGASHAHGNAVMLPHSLRAMEDREPRALARLSCALGCSTDAPAEAVSSIASLAAMVGPTTLAGIGVRHDQLDDIAEAAMGRPELANMRRPFTAPEIRRLLEDAYGS
ncbi:iron-containing alcohol dehydrogenase (plasmid) [Streptomyces sp. NBC_01450]|uniref:iron-containing alcohol dehydrogenase n=1 Tax=Streptomyces sp. NBC_01450 TaxID=2903871 RepID=UPI002E37DA69|nr:iron-containing alcohol dehydrogenase [Streptomyces sp. NBC_01450]